MKFPPGGVITPPALPGQFVALPAAGPERLKRGLEGGGGRAGAGLEREKAWGCVRSPFFLPQCLLPTTEKNGGRFSFRSRVGSISRMGIADRGPQLVARSGNGPQPRRSALCLLSPPKHQTGANSGGDFFCPTPRLFKWRRFGHFFSTGALSLVTEIVHPGIGGILVILPSPPFPVLVSPASIIHRRT